MQPGPPPPAAAKVPRKGDERRIFRDHLRRNGLRLTPERESILAEVYRIEGHFRPEDLVARLRSRGSRISRATVYRTLDLLVDTGLVRKETFRGGGAYYERAHEVQGHGHHDHLFCTSCGAIFEFHDEEIEGLQKRVCSEFGFEPHSHSHQISGICRDCRRRAAFA
jgi:Fur family ferric uptake transcriptional regulator